MVPTVILLGLLVGANVSHRSHLAPLALLGVLVSVAWGALVAASVDASFLDGTAIAVPNYAFGALVGIVLGTILRALIASCACPADLSSGRACRRRTCS